MTMTEYAHCSGPMFDGRADAAMHRGLEAVRERVAAEGVTLTRAAFLGAIRDNHGRFLASITTTGHSVVYSSESGRHSYSMPVTVDAVEDIVTTDLATYGPWLEGVGSRNHSTRFKGYHGFRRAGQALDRVAGRLGDEAIHPYVREMS